MDMPDLQQYLQAQTQGIGMIVMTTVKVIHHAAMIARTSLACC